jgi:hypothetical protein
MSLKITMSKNWKMRGVKKYCSQFGAEIFGFWRSFREGAGLQNPVAEPKRLSAVAFEGGS